jgi:predicted amidophosphoribosyltransferase
MLCSTCGTQIQFIRGKIICKTCDAEFDSLDADNMFMPEPVFVVVRLLSQYAIIDTRKQTVYVNTDSNNKAELLANNLNKHLAEAALKKRLERYYGH